MAHSKIRRYSVKQENVPGTFFLDFAGSIRRKRGRLLLTRRRLELTPSETAGLWPMVELSL
jgi:hypothetical protein